MLASALVSFSGHTAVEPFFTASCAYSTWNRCPSGENTVIALSYLAAIAPQDKLNHKQNVRLQLNDSAS